MIFVYIFQIFSSHIVKKIATVSRAIWKGVTDPDKADWLRPTLRPYIRWLNMGIANALPSPSILPVVFADKERQLCASMISLTGPAAARAIAATLL